MKKLIFIGILLLLSACNLPATADSPSTQAPLTTPETADTTQAVLPTETIAPTATPEPFPQFFTDQFDSESPYWEFMQAGGLSAVTPTFSNGTLRLDIPATDTWMIGIHSANNYENVFVRATTSVSPTGSAGLICRYSEDGWYEFNVATDGAYSLLLGQWLSDGVVKYIPVINDVSNKLTELTNTEIGMFCQDNFIQLYVNSTMINRAEVTNYGLAEGKIGISAASFTEAPNSVLFDQVQVSDQ